MENFKLSIKNLITFIINLFLFVSTLIITILGVINGAGSGQVGEEMKGLGYFKPYTIDSNVLMGLVALIFIILFIRKLITKKEISHWLNIIYLMGTSCVVLTFLTVIVFLVPVNISKGGNPWAFYSGDMFFFHLLNPVLAVISLLILQQNKKFKLKDNFIAIIPTVIYSIVYTICVLTGTWSDFYGFTFGGKYYLTPIVLIVMYLVIFFISFLLRVIKNKLTKIE